MSEFDMQKMMDSFSTNVEGDNPIQAIYDIIPTYDPVQQAMLFKLQFFIDKWELEHVHSFIKNFTSLMASNKNLGFFGSKTLQNMLSAYTQSDLIRGINIKSKESNDIVRGD